jgi:hypothetical protein
MRSLVPLAALVVSVVGCIGITQAQTSADPPTAAPTATPLINVDDMMGMYPQQTVFVATPDQVSAVTLLNHFTRYRIATNGVAQVMAHITGQWFYLLDADTAASQRLRVFDVPTGSERAVIAGISGIDPGRARGVLARANDGRVLVLKSEPGHAWVDAYAALTLEPLGTVIDRPGCADRLLTSGNRVAIVCLSTGEIAVDDLRGNHAEIEGALPNLVGAAMADDGTLFVATADQQLATVASGTTTLVGVTWPSEWSGTVLADGLASTPGASLAIAESTDDGAWLRVFATNNLSLRKSLRLAGVPQGGVLTLWPFAYYTVDSSVRHVDLTNGLLETMTEVGAGAVPGVVVTG